MTNKRKKAENVKMGNKLKKILDETNLTQKEVALRTGLSYSLINNIVNGKNAISLETAEKLSVVTGRSRYDFLNNKATVTGEVEGEHLHIEECEESIEEDDELLYDEEKEELREYFRYGARYTVVLSSNQGPEMFGQNKKLEIAGLTKKKAKEFYKKAKKGKTIVFGRKYAFSDILIVNTRLYQSIQIITETVPEDLYE